MEHRHLHDKDYTIQSFYSEIAIVLGKNKRYILLKINGNNKQLCLLFNIHLK